MADLTKDDLLRLIREHSATLEKLAKYERVVEAARALSEVSGFAFAGPGQYRAAPLMGNLREAIDTIDAEDGQ